MAPKKLSRSLSKKGRRSRGKTMRRSPRFAQTKGGPNPVRRSPRLSKKTEEGSGISKTKVRRRSSRGTKRVAAATVDNTVVTPPIDPSTIDVIS